MHVIQKLIAIPSMSGQEKDFQNYLFHYFEKIGILPIWYKDNLIVKISGKNPKNALLFNAHVDTVSPGVLEKWKNNPFQSWTEKGKVYGLGASDEKAGVASLLLLTKLLKKQQPPCDIWIMFVTSEEVDGSGTKYVVEQWHKSHASRYQNMGAILVEPTGLNSIEIGHKGNIFVELTVKGDSGHSSQPDKITTNAILLTAEIILNLQKLINKWQLMYYHPVLGKPTLAIGTSISGGNIKTPNKFADECITTLDIRTTPTLHKKVIPLLKTFINHPKIKIKTLYDAVSWGLTDRNDILVQAAQKVQPKAFITLSPGSTDQCFFYK